MLTVKVNGKKRQYPQGTSFEQIVEEFQDSFQGTIVLVIEDGKIKELHKSLQKDGVNIEFITRKDKIGYSTYVRSATLLLVKAINDLVGSSKKGEIKVEFSLGSALYCSVKGEFRAEKELVEKIKKRMKELVEANLPIHKKAYPLDQARAIFSAQGMEDKEQLFWYRRSSYVN
ncbi:MAG: nucleoside kinase, partial [Lachnospiraceae bacterium]